MTGRTERARASRRPPNHMVVPHRTRARRWQPGDVVILRHARGARTWCALPVTVLRDTACHTVVRISAGTDWFVATRPDGARAHGFDARWQLSRATWTDHDVTYSIRYGDWFAIGSVTEGGTETLVKLYVNVQAPTRRTQWGYDTMDLELDVEIDPSTSRAVWKDVVEFQRMCRAHELVPRTRRLLWQAARSARTVAPEIADRDADLRRVRCGVPDLDDAVLRKRPPQVTPRRTS